MERRNWLLGIFASLLTACCLKRAEAERFAQPSQEDDTWVMMRPTFNVGDVVRRKDDKTLMTVRECHSSITACDWFEIGSNELSRAEFTTSDLVLATVPERFLDQVRRDHSYAWSWHCNVACAAMDEGLSHYFANRAADRFMLAAFGVDSRKYSPDKSNREYQLDGELVELPTGDFIARTEVAQFIMSNDLAKSPFDNDCTHVTIVSKQNVTFRFTCSLHLARKYSLLFFGGGGGI